MTTKRIKELRGQDPFLLRGRITEEELEFLLESAELLNYVEFKGDSNDWIARDSTTGRGFRLHNVARGSFGYPTAREAIRSYKKMEGE